MGNEKKRMRVIPSDLLETQKNEAYFAYFFKICDDHQTHQAAWQWFETLRQHHGLVARFSSYESFKVSKTNFLRSRPGVVKK